MLWAYGLNLCFWCTLKVFTGNFWAECFVLMKFSDIHNCTHGNKQISHTCERRKMCHPDNILWGALGSYLLTFVVC